VWDYVSGVMKDPTTLRDDLDRTIELRRGETRGDPDKERKLWAEKLAEVEGKRARYQEMAAENLVTFEELRARLAELDERRETAERELAAIRGHEEYILALERERDALLDSLEAEAPEALDSLEPDQRHHWYRLLRLEAVVDEDGNVEVSWAGAPGGESVCQNATLSREPSPPSGSRMHRRPATRTAISCPPTVCRRSLHRSPSVRPSCQTQDREPTRSR
jgi:hypothetical protein